jgi:predicted nucleotidyltransferase
MTERRLWQQSIVSQISRILRDDPEAKAFVLIGSLAQKEVQVDEWSDVDAVVILTETALDRYFLSVEWLGSLGRPIGVERHEAGSAKTLRVCLEGLRRIDLTLVPESALADASSWEHNLLAEPYVILWSRIDGLEAKMSTLPSAQPFRDISDAEITHRADEFWSKASVAVVKVLRSDLLVAAHLVLDLVRDCLVLQMIRRDREKGTTVHRTGGFGNEIVAKLWTGGQGSSPDEMLSLLERSCLVFDELASFLWDGYEERTRHLLPAIERAKRDVRQQGTGRD